MTQVLMPVSCFLNMYIALPARYPLFRLFSRDTALDGLDDDGLAFVYRSLLGKGFLRLIWEMMVLRYPTLHRLSSAILDDLVLERGP